jgi:Bacterial protein of unknown function (DUF924)
VPPAQLVLGRDQWTALANATLKSTPSPTAEAQAVVDFWHEAGPARWFAKDERFDSRFRKSFLSPYERAAQRKLVIWPAASISALALVLLLDQFPRNAFRGTPRMYCTDLIAREVARAAIGGTTASFTRHCSSSSTSPSVIQKTWPTKSDRSRSTGALVSRICLMRNGTATSSDGLGASRIETQFLGEQ